MRITTLIENTTSRDDLQAEHGLSLYIETQHHKILFDTGDSGAFAENAQKLGVDLGGVDFAILSHGHHDHGGGLERFFALNTAAPVYLQPQALAPYYNAVQNYIGIDPKLINSDRLIFAGEETVLGEGITLYACNSRRRLVPIDSAGLQVQKSGHCHPDEFLHEQYLLVQEGEKRVLFSGCSHKGIINIAEWFQPDVLIGGFHFMQMDAHGQALRNAAQALLKYPTQYYTGHCTGQEQYHVLKEIMADRLSCLSTGVVITI